MPERTHQPSVMIRVINLGEYAVQLRGYAWAKDPHSGFVLKCDLLKSIKERFDREGIEIPYPHHQVLMNSFHEHS
jgi:small conductance mechanosensitive channel